MLRRISYSIALVLIACGGGPAGSSIADDCVKVGAMTRPARASGPLRVDPANPRYFTDGSGQAIYLTGSHTWSDLQDFGIDGTPGNFDYEAYLDFLKCNNHNFIRMWAWESARASTHYPVSPLPYKHASLRRNVADRSKYDLNRFNQAYFNRLRSRIIAARNRGIYVSIMLFQRWSIFESESWSAHPYNLSNNVNMINGDIDADGIGLEVHTLQIPAITARQEAYMRKVIDTVNQLDNVLYEISNESEPESTAWQYHMIDYIKEYEATKPKQHPVGMTLQSFHDPEAGPDNDLLFNSPADWISPGGNGYMDNPPAADGRKVILLDTDHIWGIGGNQAWVWKSFLRGLNPIFMDPYDRVDEGGPNVERWRPIRQSMGYTLIYAKRLHLAAMTPREDLASSGYCLADPGQEYLVYLPVHSNSSRSMNPFVRLERGTVTVDLSPASAPFSVEWLNPTTGETIASGTIAGGARRSFRAPFSGDAVLYIWR
jgi:hypothetical protein